MFPSSQELITFFQNQQPWAIETLQRWVSTESPTSDRDAVNRCGRDIETLMRESGARVRRVPQDDVGDHLIFETESAGLTESEPMLFLGHIDTVWPVGQIQRMPLRRDGELLFGPGVYDMKAGVLLMLLCLRGLRHFSAQPRRPIRILLTSDEERGSDVSKTLVEETARGSRYVLCLEPPLPGNKAKTFRKGVYHFHVEAIGRAAHAGVDHEKGINAIEELAHQILRLQAMTDYAAGTTVNVGSLQTHNAANVVPDYAGAEVDVRASTIAAGEEISARILGLRPVDPRVSLRVRGGIGRPPLERTDGVVWLYRHAAGLAAELGFELGEGSTGGGSDGSLTAAMGIPTLDGMGVDGAGSHSLEEHIIVSDVPRKAALLTRMVLDL